MQDLCSLAFPMPAIPVSLHWEDLENACCFWMEAEGHYILVATPKSAKASQSWGPGQAVRWDPFAVSLAQIMEA